MKRLGVTRREELQRFLRAMFARKIVAVATIVVVIIVLAAIFAPVFAPFDPN